MNKARVEAFSDGVFSIVVTLLIFEVKVPEISAIHSNAQLWHQLYVLSPVFATYFVSFAVVGSFWINHHFIFHTFVKSVDRQLNLLNLLYLSFVAFVPFSSQLLGSFLAYQPAAIIYGLNIFVVVALARLMINYTQHHPELLSDSLSRRLLNQARFRTTLTLICYTLGLMCSFYILPATILLFAFPIAFNIIPGMLDLLERNTGLSLD